MYVFVYSHNIEELKQEVHRVPSVVHTAGDALKDHGGRPGNRRVWD